MKTQIKLLVKERITLENLTFVDDLNGWVNNNFYIYKQEAVCNFNGSLRQDVGLQQNNWYRVSYSKSYTSRGFTHFVLGGNPSSIHITGGRHTEVLQSFGTSFQIFGNSFRGSIWNIVIEPLSYEVYYLDLYEDVPIQTTYQTFDIETLQTTASYSRSFKVPATEHNKKVFEFANIIESNQDKTYLNRKIQCEVLIDGVKTFEGNLYLNSINRNDNDNVIDFDVNLYSYNLDLFNSLGDELLVGNDDQAKDLDFSEYSNNMTVRNIINSWDDHWTGSQTTESKGVVFPPCLTLNSSTYESSNDNLIFVETQRPAFFVKEIFDKIFDSVGFTYQSEFLNSDLFKALIVPSTDKTNEPDIDKMLNSFRAGLDTTLRFERDPNWDVPSTSYIKFFKANSKAESSDKQTYSTKYWKIPYNNDNKTENLFTPWYDSWNFIQNNFFTTTNEAYINKAGKYKFNATLKLRARLQNLSDSQVLIVRGKKHTLGGLPATLVIEQRRGSQLISNRESILFPIFPSLESSSITVGAGAFSDWTKWAELDFNSGVLDCQVGDSVTAYLNLDSFNSENISLTSLSGQQGSNLFRNLAYQFEMKANESVFFSEVFDTEEVNYGELLNPSKWLPKNIKKSQFLLEIGKLFNLKFDDKTNKTKHLLIEPYKEYYDLGTIKDFTAYQDTNSDVYIRRNENLIDKYINLTFSEGSDYYNTDYEDKNGKIFGRQIVLSEDGGQETFDIQSMFSALIMKKLDSCTTLQLPYFDKNLQSRIENWSPPAIGLRIGIWHGSNDSTSSLSKFRLSSGDSLTYINFPKTISPVKFTSADYIGFMSSLFDIQSHYVNPYSTDLETFEVLPTDYLLNYGVSNTYYAPINLSNNNVPTLYNRFYKVMFDETFSINSKLVDMNIIIPPSELYNLYLYDTIYVEPNYYRIIKIHDYNNLTYNTKMTLLLITNSIIPRRYRIGKKKSNNKVIVNGFQQRLDQRNPGILDIAQINLKPNDSIWTIKDFEMEYKSLINNKSYGIVSGVNNQIGRSDNIFISGNTNRILDNVQNVSVFGNSNDVEFSNVLQTSQTILSTNAGVVNSYLIDYGKVNEKTFSSASPVNYIEGGKTDTTKFEGSYSSVNFIDPINRYIYGDLNGVTGLAGMQNNVTKNKLL